MTTEVKETSDKKLVAEIISIGDEICCGAIVDTNAPYLSESLAEIGVRTLYHSTIGDDADAMESAFALAFHRADVIVCTGGLGPTQDDLTRQIAAKVLDVELEFDQASFEHTSRLFERRGRVMPDSNRIQAYFPSGSRVIANPNGTAPGFIIESTPSALPPFANHFLQMKGVEDSRPFIALFFPGVPAEMKEMWRGANGRAAIERFVQTNVENKRVYRTKLIHSFGLGESAVEAKLPNLIARDHFPPVGITAKNSVITLRIFAEGATSDVCDEQIREISEIIYDAIGDYVDKLDAYATESIDAAKRLQEIGDSRYRCVLMLYYVNGRTWEQVGATLKYAPEYCRHLRNDALPLVYDIMPREWRTMIPRAD